jgi:hypothetical protein
MLTEHRDGMLGRISAQWDANSPKAAGKAFAVVAHWQIEEAA